MRNLTVFIITINASQKFTFGLPNFFSFANETSFLEITMLFIIM